jgi:hypothetical protein
VFIGVETGQIRVPAVSSSSQLPRNLLSDDAFGLSAVDGKIVVVGFGSRIHSHGMFTYVQHILLQVSVILFGL